MLEDCNKNSRAHRTDKAMTQQSLDNGRTDGLPSRQLKLDKAVVMYLKASAVQTGPL